jgi:hypothetical protein
MHGWLSKAHIRQLGVGGILTTGSLVEAILQLPPVCAAQQASPVLIGTGGIREKPPLI